MAKEQGKRVGQGQSEHIYRENGLVDVSGFN